jgi:hypothetical protein
MLWQENHIDTEKELREELEAQKIEYERVSAQLKRELDRNRSIDE